MKLSINWLRDFIDLDLKVEDLADKLTNAGFEVESIDPMCEASNLVVGEVLSCENHPDSDHLHVCMVNVGTSNLQIVCGAPNVAKGQKVIVALVGAKLPGIDIKKSTIRGVESNGMICSLLELGLDKKQLKEEQINGIEVLSDLAIPGSDPLKLLGLDDTILDISITPNRADCNAVFDLVREIGAIIDKPVKLPEIKAIKGEKTLLNIDSTTKNCPLFFGRIVRGVKLKESPLWMKNILAAYGIKSINNVVDISNLVMLETGQPLHFYDLDKLPKAELVCSDDYSGEYTALDGNKYELIQGDLVIKSGGSVVGIAGIMGGEDSKISDETVNILVESANFALANIRLTSRRLNLMTEAATHFSKGISKHNTFLAIERASTLLEEYCDVSSIEEVVTYGDALEKEKIIELTLTKCNELLNSNLSLKEVSDIFRRLSFNYKVNGETFSVEVPSYRLDLELSEDLIEEVIRLAGYDKIIGKLPTMYTTIGSLAKHERSRYQVKEVLNGFGISEVITYSLIGKRLLDDSCWPIGEAIELSNPLSEERRYYRSSLLPSLLEVISYNQARFQDNYAFFEVGKVYGNNEQVQERLSIGLSKQINLSKWKKLSIGVDFYLMKGRIETLLESFGFDARRIYYKENTVDEKNFHPKQSACVYIDKTLVGVFGKIHPKQKNKYDIEDCVLAELNLSAIYQANAGKVKFKAISKYPSVSFDLSMIIKDSVTADEIIDCVNKNAKGKVKNIEIFDIFKGAAIKEDHKSIAISMLFQSDEKTLDEKDIAPVVSDIMNGLRNTLEAIIRDK